MSLPVSRLMMGRVLDVTFGIVTLTMLVLLIRVNGCPSPTPMNIIRTGTNSSTCPWRCCCNDTSKLVNCSRLYQNLPTVFPVRARTIYLDWNDMDTFDRENCSVFKQSKSLETLSATNNRISNINKNCFTGIGNITVLNLSNNALTNFPLADAPYPFRTVDLSSNDIKKLNESVFLSMPNLTRLNLDNNSIEILPAQLICRKEGLKYLSLRDNGLTTIRFRGPFTGESNIEELYLSNNNIWNISHSWLVGAFKLRILDLRNATADLDVNGKEEWHFPGFAELLEEIDLSLNGLRSILHGAFDSNKALRTIDLSSNDLSFLPDGLLLCKENLTAFSAQGNRLVNISSAIWGESASLEYVNLANNSIERVEKDAFRSLGRLRYLDLSGNQLVSLTFLEPPDLRTLETLILHNNSISVALNLTGLINLCVIRLQDNNLSDVPIVQNLSQLEEIDLSRNNISVVRLVAFEGTRKLKRINLESNYITTIASDGLRYLPQSLVWLNLVKNPLRCDCRLALVSTSLSAYQWGINLGNLTCASPSDYAGDLVSAFPKSSCTGSGSSARSIILLALLAGIVIAVIILALLYSKYRRVGRGNSRRRRSYPVEEKAAQMNAYQEEAGHLMSPSKGAGNYHNLRASNDLLGAGSVTGSSTKINGSAIKPFEEEFYV